MEIPRIYVVGGAALLVLAIAIPVTIDVLTVSDEELIEKFIEDVTGEVDRDYVMRALGYVDLARVPLDAEVMLPVASHAGVYDAARSEELTSRFRKYMRPYYGNKIRLLKKRIEIDGDRAEVLMVIFGRQARLRVEIAMRKLDGRWWVASCHISR